MSFLSSFDISASGLTAQRLRMDVISQNIANIDTTRTEAGGPYRRRVAVFASKEGNAFASYLSAARAASVGRGVYIARIAEDMSDFKMEYDPTHPDANADGYVSLPNVDEATEMVDMMSATRSYEANVTAFNAMKNIAMKALEIGK
ncbi:MAG: flagellar basal body rod protein FlgC [Christensenellales bacterium]